MTTREVLGEAVIAILALDRVRFDAPPAEQRETLGGGLLILEGHRAINVRMTQPFRRPIRIFPTDLPIDRDRRTLAHACVIVWQAISHVMGQRCGVLGAFQ
jgi:hypothetical protein